MSLLRSFPSQAPYRVDQVTMAPQLMLGLAIAQLILAGGLLRWSQGKRWWTLTGLLLILSAVFFALANWGTSDITRFSHYLGVDQAAVLN